MNELKEKRKEFFYNYYQKSNDSERLTFILLIFAFIICPLFAFLFKQIGSPIIYFYIILSATIVFPFILFLEKIFIFLKGKLPILYFVYFIILTLIVIFNINFKKSTNNEITYFLVFFSLLIVGIHRFYLSLFYFIITFISLLIVLYIKKDTHDFSHLIVLTACIGLFVSIIFYSRNKMVNSIEDHNLYLKRIVNNLGNGVVLFQIRGNTIFVIDYNKTLSAIYLSNQIEEIELVFTKNINEEELFEIQNIKENEFFKKEHQFNNITVHELTISKILLKKGIYFLAIIQDITEKVNETNLVLLNEKKYKNLYLRNQTGIFTLNKSGRLIDSNPAFLKIFDLKETENFYLFQEKNKFNELKEDLIKKGVIINYNLTYFNDFENELYLVLNLYYDSENELIEGNMIDITDLTLNSFALQEKEKKYRLIYEESNDSILILEDDRIIDINQKGLKLFNLSFEKIVEKSLWDFTYNQSPELKKQLDNYFERLKTEKNIKFNWIFSQKEGFLETEISVAEINIGDFSYYQCVIHDETERNKYLKSLEQSKKTFESIIENTPEGFLILKKNQILYTNSEFFNIFSIKKKETIAFDETIFGVNFNKIEKLLFQKKENTDIRNEQIQFFIDGKSMEIDVTIVSIIFDEQDADMIIFKDVSFQNKLSKEQLRAELAEETSKRLVKEIEERKLIELKLETEYLRTKAIFESSDNTLLLTLTPDLKISSFNLHSKTYFDYQTKNELALNLDFEKYFEQIISPIKLRYFRYLISSIRKGKSYQLQLKFINRENERKWVELYLNPIKDLNQVVSEISLVAHDITEKKNNEREMISSLKEKEVLLKEVHHRVKNNLQIISSILNLQSSYIDDKKILEILEESRHRIRSMAIIHENLYQTTNFSSINFKNYSRELVRNLISSYHFNTKTEVEIIENVEKVDLSLDQAIPCGLIINELITNSLKYAFQNNKKGKIFLELSDKNGQITLVVGDNGIGLPKNFDINKTETLGLQLVSTLVEQIDGNIKLEKSKGIKYFITFGKQKL
jgi:PAS domain S-box-containing protein